MCMWNLNRIVSMHKYTNENTQTYLETIRYINTQQITVNSNCKIIFRTVRLSLYGKGCQWTYWCRILVQLGQFWYTILPSKHVNVKIYWKLPNRMHSKEHPWFSYQYFEVITLCFNIFMNAFVNKHIRKKLGMKPLLV